MTDGPLATLDRDAAGRRRRRGRQAITMGDVADRAKVSPSTVSLYLRKPAAVSPETGTVIAAAIAELGYVQNLAAGALAAARTPVVSLIVPSIRNAFFAETASALQAGLFPAQRQLILGDTEYEARREERLVRTALAWRPAAIVLTGLHHSRTVVSLLKQCPTTVVEMWDFGETPLQHVVGFSHSVAGIMATRHLIERGARRIVFAGGRMRADRRAAQRADGYRQALREAGLGEGAVFDAPEAAETGLGVRHLGQIRDAVPDVDAIVCSNDSIALGILFEAQRRGVRVPDDLRVVGFGDLSFAPYAVPPLTTIRPPSAQIGRTVADIINRDEAGSGSARMSVRIDPQMIVRSST